MLNVLVKVFAISKKKMFLCLGGSQQDQAGWLYLAMDSSLHSTALRLLHRVPRGKGESAIVA